MSIRNLSKFLQICLLTLPTLFEFLSPAAKLNVKFYCLFKAISLFHVNITQSCCARQQRKLRATLQTIESSHDGGIASNEPANCVMHCNELSKFRESPFMAILSAAGSHSDLAWAGDQAPAGCLLMNHATRLHQSRQCLPLTCNVIVIPEARVVSTFQKLSYRRDSARRRSNYAVQSHPSSPISVPIEGPYATSY